MHGGGVKMVSDMDFGCRQKLYSAYIRSKSTSIDTHWIWVFLKSIIRAQKPLDAEKFAYYFYFPSPGHVASTNHVISTRASFFAISSKCAFKHAI